jgi:hypothetical protein
LRSSSTCSSISSTLRQDVFSNKYYYDDNCSNNNHGNGGGGGGGLATAGCALLPEIQTPGLCAQTWLFIQQTTIMRSR